MKLFLLYFLIYLLLFQVISSQKEESIRFTVDYFPNFDNSDIVEFYYLEGSFPYTTPQQIIQTAGEQWNQYSLSHAGIGIWNKDKHIKLSIELVSNNYVGALLPVVQNNNLIWNNEATIILTKPMNETFWSESRLLAVSNGAAYKYIKQYLTDNEKKYSIYQPVIVFSDDGKLQIASKDSYSFVQDLFNELVDYRLPLNTFLPIQRTYYSYHSKSISGSIQKLSWSSTTLPPSNVTQWYSNLIDCYTQTWKDDSNAALFLLDVQKCYTSGYAFIYDTDYSVYQIYLSSITPTPVLYREEIELPEVSTQNGMNWTLTDTILTITFFSVAITGIFIFLYKILWLKTTRSKGSIKDDEDVAIIVEEMIKKKREITPSTVKTATGTTSTGRETMTSQRDTLYNYFNRRTDPNIEENDSKPSGLLSFLRFRSKGYTAFPTTGYEVNDNYTAFIPNEEKSDIGNQTSPHSSIKSTRSSISPPSTTIRSANPILTSSISSTPSTVNSNLVSVHPAPPPLTTSTITSTSNENEFLDFIQQPTTKVYISNSYNSNSNSTNIVNERENSHSSDVEEGVRLSRLV